MKFLILLFPILFFSCKNVQNDQDYKKSAASMFGHRIENSVFIRPLPYTKALTKIANRGKIDIFLTGPVMIVMDLICSPFALLDFKLPRFSTTQAYFQLVYGDDLNKIAIEGVTAQGFISKRMDVFYNTASYNRKKAEKGIKSLIDDSGYNDKTSHLLAFRLALILNNYELAQKALDTADKNAKDFFLKTPTDLFNFVPYVGVISTIGAREEWMSSSDKINFAYAVRLLSDYGNPEILTPDNIAKIQNISENFLYRDELGTKFLWPLCYNNRGDFENAAEHADKNINSLTEELTEKSWKDIHDEFEAPSPLIILSIILAPPPTFMAIDQSQGIVPLKYRLAVSYKEKIKALCQLGKVSESRKTLTKLKKLTDERSWKEWMYFEAAFYESLYSGRFKEAEEWNTKLSDYCLSTANFTRLLHLGLKHGELLESKGQSDAAINGYIKVIDSIDSLYKRAGTDTLFSENFNQLHIPFYEKVISLMVKSGKPAMEILVIAEKTKSRILAQILLSRNNAAHNVHPDDRDEYLKLQGLYRNQKILAASLTNEEERKQAQVSVDFIKEKMNRLEKLSGEKGAERRGVLTLTGKSSVMMTRDFISYWTGPEFSLRFVNHNGTLSMTKLPARSQIAELVEEYRNHLQDHTSDPLNSDSGKKLSKMLLPENMPESVLIIPDGELNLLPFETLNYKNKYLLSAVELTYSPSLTVASTLKNEGTDYGKMLIVANPDFGSTGTAQMRSYFKERGNSLPQLPGTQLEASAISKAFTNATVLTGSLANEESFREKNPAQFSILHFATHGLLEDEFDGLSEPALALTKSASGDGFLTASEINRMELKAKLVTLSACNTAAGKISSGDGVVSLASSFLNAGSSNVVVSTWSVADDATAALMAEFYALLKGGKNVSQALKEAKLMLMTNRTEKVNERIRGVAGTAVAGQKNYSHPYFWAPFIHIGK